jgi:hypothetical protein
MYEPSIWEGLQVPQPGQHPELREWSNRVAVLLRDYDDRLSAKLNAIDAALKKVDEGAALTPEMFGSDGVDDTAAINAADAFSAGAVRFKVGKTYNCPGQLIACQTSKKRWFCEGGTGAAKIVLSYTGGDCVKVGATGATTYDIEFDGIEFQHDSTTPMFELRRGRNVTFRRCVLSEVYYGFKLGTATDMLYIWNLFDCYVYMRAGANTYFFNLVNCAGQIDFSNSYIEGTYVAGSYGGRMASNVQPRLDHFIIKGGYFGRFSRLLYSDVRIVNFEIGGCAHFEGWTVYGFDFDANSSCEIFNIGGGVVFGVTGSAASLHAIYIHYTQLTDSWDGVNIGNVIFAQVLNQPAIEIVAPATNKLKNLTIGVITFMVCKDNVDNNHAVIEIFNVVSGVINTVEGTCTDVTKRFAYLVRIVASGINVPTDYKAIGFANTPAVI